MRHLADTYRLGLLGLVSAALLGQANAAPPRPALEIALTPDPNPSGLMVYAFAHDLMARLEGPIPRRRAIIFVDAGSPKTPGVPRVSLAPDPDGLRVTWPQRGNLTTEPEALSAERFSTLADDVAARLGWPAIAPQPALPDPVAAGLLLVFPERSMGLPDPLSSRALELFRRQLERRDEPLSQSLVSDLRAAEVASSELIEDDPKTCFEHAEILAAIATDGPLAEALTAKSGAGGLEALLNTLDSTRGPGLESAWHLAALSANARANLNALAAVYHTAPDQLLQALERRDSWGATPLLRSLWAGRLDSARILIVLGARLAARTSDGVNALHAAARAGLATELPRLAARLPASYLEQRDARGLTPLGHAVRAPSEAVASTVAALLRAGAKVGPDAVAGACATGDLVLASSLLRGASREQPELPMRAAESALRLGSAESQNAAWASYAEDKISLSLAFSCVAVLAGISDAGVFAKALEYGRADLATSLLVLGLPPNARRTLDGSSLLHLAARHREPGLVRMLAALGADPSSLDDQLATALEVAVEGGHLPTLRALLEVSDGRVDLAAALDRAFETATEPAVFGAIVEGRWESLALTPLEAARVAVVMGDLARLEPILKVHAAQKAQDAQEAHGSSIIGDQAPHGLGLLHFAARFGQASIVKRLVLAGEPLALEIVAGTRWLGRDLTGWTALHLAAFHGRIATYQALVASGARSSVAADGTRPEDHLRLGGLVMGDLGSIGSAGGWQSQLNWPPPYGDSDQGDVPEADDVPDPTAPEIKEERNRPITSHGAQGFGGPSNPAKRASFIGLGGGILLDEAPGPEFEPRRETVVGKADSFGPAHGWQDQIEGCLEVLERDAERRPGELSQPDSLARERRFRALAVARSRARWLVAERARSPIGLGPAVLAVAEQTLARVELAARNPVAAEAAVARAEQRLVQVNAVALALTLTKARAQRARGALALAVETLGRVGFQAGEVWARIQHWRGLWLGEQARYGEAVTALRFAVAARPGHFAARLNLATLLGRVGAKEEAKRLAETLHVGAARAGATAVEAAVAAFSAGLWRLSGGDAAGRLMVEEALVTIGKWSIGHPAIGRVALALARLERGERRHDEALRWLTKARTALTESDGEDAAILGAVKGEESEVLRELGRLDDALVLGREAYLFVVASEEPELVWPVERALAQVHRARGGAGLLAAIVFGKRAVATLERIRAEVRASSPELVRGFTEDRIAAWRELANDLVKAGRYVEALGVLDELKIDERQSLATRELVQERREPVLLQAEKAPNLVANEQAERQVKGLLVASAERELTPREASVLAGLRASLRERRKAFEVWLVSLEDELAKMPPKRAQQIAALNLRDVAAIQGTLERLGPTVAVLHYVFADDKLRVVVTTAKGQVGRDAELGAADVGALVVAFREQLIDPTSDPRPVARELWGQLIGPIEADLKEAQVDTLFFALDGPLRYLPMAALWDGERWLVERFKVAHLARASLDKLESRIKATDEIAALGSAKAIPGYAPLTAVKDELEGVVKRDAADPSGVMPGVIRLDEAFTKDALTGLLASRKYAAYHIASHFVLGAGGEANSYLLLGDGSKLTLDDIRFELRFDGVDLLALSACNTALGEETDGRELEGFASLALRLGARQVLATLWPVGDTSTGRLMQSLYRWQQVAGVGRAEALRLAMLGLIRGAEMKADDIAKGMTGEVAWESCGQLSGDRHPFHWAPFILIGSWL